MKKATKNRNCRTVNVEFEMNAQELTKFSEYLEKKHREHASSGKDKHDAQLNILNRSRR